MLVNKNHHHPTSKKKHTYLNHVLNSTQQIPKKKSPPPRKFQPGTAGTAGTGWLVSLLRPDFVILMNVWWRCSGETTMVMVASQDGSAPFATWMVRLSKRWKAFCQARCATVENCNDSCWWKFGRVEMMSLKCFLCKNCLTRVYLWCWIEDTNSYNWCAIAWVLQTSSTRDLWYILHTTHCIYN